MNWEQPSFRCGENVEVLLNDVGKQCCAKYCPHCDGSCIVPLPCTSSKGEDYLEECEDYSIEYCTNPIDSSELRGSRDIWLWVVLWKEEEVDGCQERSKRKVDVEGPAPSR